MFAVLLCGNNTKLAGGWQTRGRKCWFAHLVFLLYNDVKINRVSTFMRNNEINEISKFLVNTAKSKTWCIGGSFSIGYLLNHRQCSDIDINFFKLEYLKYFVRVAKAPIFFKDVWLYEMIYEGIEIDFIHHFSHIVHFAPITRKVNNEDVLFINPLEITMQKLFLRLDTGVLPKDIFDIMSAIVSGLITLDDLQLICDTYASAYGIDGIRIAIHRLNELKVSPSKTQIKCTSNKYIDLVDSSGMLTTLRPKEAKILVSYRLH